MSNTQHIDKTSAEDKSIGFDYQYYYFLNALLNLEKGQTVGLEVMDDVHTELADHSQILVQLKYTTQKKADGSPKNLTSLDGDFWKTVSNWCKVITDDKAGRKHAAEQQKFVNRTVFLLASNKSENKKNTFISDIKKFQDNEIQHSDLCNELSKLKAGTKNAEIGGFIEDVLKLDQEVSQAFWTRIQFDLGCDGIIAKCKESIAQRFIDPERIDDVFHSLDSQIRADNFELVTQKQKISISFEDFLKRYRIHFDKARNSTLKIRKFDALPDDFGDQLFLQQLVDIGDVEVDDIEQIARLSYHHLLAKNNVERWVQDGEVTSLDVEALEEDVLTLWRNLFRKAYRGNVSDEAINSLAQGIIDDLRMTKLAITQQELDLPFSNGEIYDLCEQSKLGWRSDWETKYK
ncbi:MAG: hypothetical protein WA790_14710 [Sulfitobacter sp.]